MWKYIRQLNAYMCPKCKHIRSYTPPYCEICGNQNGSEYDKRYVDELFEMSETDNPETEPSDVKQQLAHLESRVKQLQECVIEHNKCILDIRVDINAIKDANLKGGRQ